MHLEARGLHQRQPLQVGDARKAMRHPQSRIKPRLGVHHFLHDQTGVSLRVARFAGLFGMPAGVLGEESPCCRTFLPKKNP